MNCKYSEETMALFVEDDLPSEQADNIARHLSDCDRCRKLCERLQTTQAFLKARLRPVSAESISRQTLADVRHAVLAEIQDWPKSMGLRGRFERALWLGYRKNVFAWASLAIIVVVSATALVQARRSAQAAGPVAMFDAAGNTLMRPDGYRDWVLLGSSFGKHVAGSQTEAAATAETSRTVYLNRPAYKAYKVTGKFPEGTVLVLELGKAAALEVSVKDSARFAAGWGFFDFSSENGSIPNKVQALPESSNCRSCHQTCAETDQVFTQFYPILRSTRT